MQIQAIGNSYGNQSFKGRFLKTPELEAYIKTLSSAEYDNFANNVARMRRVKDGKKYVFLKDKDGLGCIKSVENKPTIVAITGLRHKKAVDYLFKQLFSKYTIKKNLLDSRRNRFLNNLEEYHG